MAVGHLCTAHCGGRSCFIAVAKQPLLKRTVGLLVGGLEWPPIHQQMAEDSLEHVRLYRGWNRGGGG